MRTTAWDLVVIALTSVIYAAGTAVREPSLGAAWGGAVIGLILGTLFCTFVRLVTLPLQREVEGLRQRLAEVERRAPRA